MESFDKMRDFRDIGPYRVIRELSKPGGLSRLFEVELRKKHVSPESDKHFVVKVVTREQAELVKREVAFLSRLRSENVVRLLPIPDVEKLYGEAETKTGKIFYYVMEYTEGLSLDHYIEPNSSENFIPDLVLVVACQVAKGLAEIHNAGILHLDLKPGNVLVRRPLNNINLLRKSISVCISDFDAAMEVDKGQTITAVTPEYLSPEQLILVRGMDSNIDQRSDIFSLGVIIYEMCTGRLPFELRDSPDGKIPDFTKPRGLISHYNPYVPERLDRIVEKALSIDPDERYDSSEILYEELSGIVPRSYWVMVKNVLGETVRKIRFILLKFVRRLIQDVAEKVKVLLPFFIEYKFLVFALLAVVGFWILFRPSVHFSIDTSLLQNIWSYIVFQNEAGWLSLALSILAFVIGVLNVMLIRRTRKVLGRPIVSQTTKGPSGTTASLKDATHHIAYAKLIVIEGSRTEAKFRLRGSLTKIGREPQFSDIPLYENAVSNPHCSIIYNEDRICYITDEGSTNGTWLNGAKLQPHQRYPLKSGAVIEVGCTKLMLKRLGGVTKPIVSPSSRRGPTKRVP